MKNRGRCCERDRRWLLAVALLAGGTGIGLGSVLAALLAGTGVSPLMWVSLAGRLVATIGIVFAWSSLEARPLAIRLFRTHAERLVNARRTRPRGLGRTERLSSPLHRRVRSLLDRLRSHWQRRGRSGSGHRRTGRRRARRRPNRRVQSRSGWLFRRRSRSRSRLSSPSPLSPPSANARSVLPERVGTLLSRAPVVEV